MPYLAPNRDIGNVANIDWRAFNFLQNNLANVFGLGDQTHPPYEVALGIGGQLSAARIGIVACQGFVNILQANLVMAQALRIDQHLVFLSVSPLGINFCNAWNGTQHWSHDPVLNGSALS